MRIHIKSKSGMFTVAKYNSKSILLHVGNGYKAIPVSDFRCLAGGTWNFNLSKEEEEKFLNTVAPERMAKLESETQAILNNIDALKRLSDLEDKVFQNEQASIEDNDNYDDNCGYDDYGYDDYINEYNTTIDQYKSEIEELKSKMFKIGVKVYQQELDFSDFEDYNGRKFVIKANNDKTEFKFCFDPFGFTSNAHSSISYLCYIEGFGTINGGWIKVIGNDVILYYKSGDYGVYDDTVAIECAKKVFPGKNIHSYAGREWDRELTDKFDPLPF